VHEYVQIPFLKNLHLGDTIQQITAFVTSENFSLDNLKENLTPAKIMKLLEDVQKGKNNSVLFLCWGAGVLFFLLILLCAARWGVEGRKANKRETKSLFRDYYKHFYMWGLTYLSWLFFSYPIRLLIHILFLNSSSKVCSQLVIDVRPKRR
jgi:hypothetical protein